ncbi:MAG: cupin domain-containing protein [Thermoplasmata archaeon]|nr:cupin domain-containing protein [Thermoplasmata archaeon]
MTKTILMKKGESLKDEKRTGVLYRNVLMVEKMEATVTHILPTCKTQGFSHKGKEIKFMVKGELEYHVGDEAFTLQEGDTLFHHSDDKHWAENKGTGEAIFITVSTPGTFSMFYGDDGKKK